jgi:hypothetical protein
MFGFLKKKEEQRPATAAAPAPASQGGIQFHPELIGELVSDHHRLLHLHGGIRECFDRRDLAMVSGKLKEFGVLLRNHLLTENMRLYIYLQQKMAGDEVNTTLVRSFRKEMDGIAKTALEFLEKYNELEKMPEAHLSSFAAEFDQIGSVVHARMQREEETLYPLYAASY